MVKHGPPSSKPPANPAEAAETPEEPRPAKNLGSAGPGSRPSREELAKLPPPPQQLVDLPPAAVMAARNHLVATFGQPSNVLDLRGKKPMERLEVALFQPPQAGAPLILVTCGASVVAEDGGRRFELVYFAKPAPAPDVAQQLAKMMAALASSPLTRSAKLGPGTVLADPELKELTGGDGLLLLPALIFAPDVARFTRPDGAVVELLWVVSVHANEVDYAEKKGVQELYKRFEEEAVDLAVLGRAPASLSGKPPPPKKPEPPKRGKPAAKHAPRAAKPAAKPNPAKR